MNGFMNAYEWSIGVLMLTAKFAVLRQTLGAQYNVFHHKRHMN